MKACARSSAKAVLLKWNGERYARTSEEVVIHDFVDTHGDKGDRGYGFLSPESGRWETVSGLFEQSAGWMPS